MLVYQSGLRRGTTSESNKILKMFHVMHRTIGAHYRRTTLRRAFVSMRPFFSAAAVMTRPGMMFALLLLALAAVQSLHAFQIPCTIPNGMGSRRYSSKMGAARSRMLLEIDPTPNFPRIPSPSTDPDDRRRLAKILEKSTALDLLAEQVTDAVSDIGLHLGRDVDSALERLKIRREQGKGPTKKKVVVLGSGWGAHALVKVIDTDKFDVQVIAPRPYFIFTPMLAASSVGTVEYRSISEAMRASNPFVDFVQASATGIDTDSKMIKCKSVLDAKEFEVSYDYLVVGVGVQSATFGVPGVKEHCCFLKNVDDAITLRSRLVQQFEAASLPGLTEKQRRALLTFVVVGGGPTGVEFSGELFDFLRQDVRRYYPKLADFVSTKLIQSGPSVLEMFDKTMQDMALRTLLDAGTEVILKGRVEEVRDDTIRFSRVEDDDTRVNTEIDYGLCVWAAGNAPLDISLELIKKQEESAASKAGRIQVDPWLRMTGVNDGSVFAMGDCACIEETPLPQTAQVAGQQGAYIAHIFNREADLSEEQLRGFGGYGWPIQSEIERGVRDGDPVATAMSKRKVTIPKPFEFLSLGVLAYIGGNKALAQVEVYSSSTTDGSQMISFRKGGWAGWVLWRSVYLTKQVAFRNRVLVLFDWMKSRVFGRDIACL